MLDPMFLTIECGEPDEAETTARRDRGVASGRASGHDTRLVGGERRGRTLLGFGDDHCLTDRDVLIRGVPQAADDFQRRCATIEQAHDVAREGGADPIAGVDGERQLERANRLLVMVFHRPYTQLKLLRDFSVAHPVGLQAQNFSLSWRQRGSSIVRCG